MADDWGLRTGISNKRETGTGVAIVKRRASMAGVRVELTEIESYLYGDMPLNKTEYERLRRRRGRILRILAGRDARYAVMGGRLGSPNRHERVSYGVKKASLNMLDLLSPLAGGSK